MADSLTDFISPEEISGDGNLILDPNDPLPAARAFVARQYRRESLPTLKHQEGVFYEWQQEFGTYAEMTTAQVKAEMYPFLEKSQCWVKKGGGFELADFKPTKSKVENVIDALRAVTNLPSSSAAPCWLDDRPELLPADMLPCRNGLLHIPKRTLYERTPALFALNGADLDFNPTTETPKEWLKFMRQLWDDDDDSINALQEWFGYSLSPRTEQQKIAMLVGPRRAGKGTIGRVLRGLCGERNYCAPTLDSMGKQFGLAVLIGKSVAVISDARISGRTDTAVLVERLLSVSGEDTQTIPRKYLPDWTGKLPTRFLLMTNELPHIEDSSGALASRFLILTLKESFYGKENPELFDSFIPELPGVLNWALDGLTRLNTRKRFKQPEASEQLIERLADLSSPVSAFIRDEEYDVKAGARITCDDLYGQWRNWCLRNGRKEPGPIQIFSRNMHAVMPWLKMTRPRVNGLQVSTWEGIGTKKASNAGQPTREESDEPLEEAPF